MDLERLLACNGAPGVPKPGTDRLTYMGIGAVEAIIGSLTSGIGEVALAALFAGKSYDLLHICSSPDPGDPGMTVDDWANAINYAEPQLNIPAVSKAQQWFLHVMWPIWCNCSDGTQPPPTTTTAPPSVQPNPNSAPAPLGGNCWQSSITKSTSNANAQMFLNEALPPVPTHKVPPVNGTVGIQAPLPASLSVTYSIDTNGANPVTCDLQVGAYDINGVLLSPQINIRAQAPGAPASTASMTLPANAVDWGIGQFASAGGGVVSTAHSTVQATIYCAGQSPTGVQSPCCPPDPSVDLRLGSIMDMLTQLLSLQTLKGAYQETVHHTGLIGDGTITINPASSAIRVDITSDLTSWPNNSQTPTYFYSLGFITPYAVGTPLKGSRVVYNHQTFTWPSYTDQIGYALAAGVTANIVELTQGA